MGGMMATETIHPAGTMLVLTDGDYSSYGIICHVVTLKPCNMPDLWRAWEGAEIEDSDRYRDMAFVPWLIINGYVAEIEVEEVHIGRIDEEECARKRAAFIAQSPAEPESSIFGRPVIRRNGIVIDPVIWRSDDIPSDEQGASDILPKERTTIVDLDED